MSDSCDPMNCSPPGSSVHGILQARVLAWVAISFSKRDRAKSCPTLVIYELRRRPSFRIGSFPYNWKFINFDKLHLIPLPLPSTFGTTNLFPFFYEFAWFRGIIDLQHHVSFCYITVIWYFYTFQNKHCDKFSCCLSLYKNCIISDHIPHTLYFIPVTYFIAKILFL